MLIFVWTNILTFATQHHMIKHEQLEKGEGNMPEISVIVPFYNCVYIQYALDSLIHQTERDFEIILIDDGSTAYQELLEPYDKHIRYIRKENGGTATALNTGIQHATGKYFTWLSSDDLYAPTKLSKQKEFMENQQADICYTSAGLIGETHTIQKDLFQKQFTNEQQFLKELNQRCIIHGNAVMMNMEVISKIGGFNEEFRYTHDYEMWLRAALLFPFHHVNEILVYYRIHEKMGTNQHKEEIIQELKKLRWEYKGKYRKKLSSKSNELKDRFEQ